MYFNLYLYRMREYLMRIIRGLYLLSFPWKISFIFIFYQDFLWAILHKDCPRSFDLGCKYVAVYTTSEEVQGTSEPLRVA